MCLDMAGVKYENKVISMDDWTVETKAQFPGGVVPCLELADG